MYKQIIVILLLAEVLNTSCKKDSYNNIVPTATLNVINAAPDVPSLNVNLTSTPIAYSLYQQPIYYATSWEWGLPPGDSPIVIISSLDTSNALFSGNINLKAGGIYSLYILNGIAKGNALFLQDSIPVYQDSLAGVRFINLSPDSHPITINLVGNSPSIKEFGPLSYEQISSFKAYNAKSMNTNGFYDFEVRDQDTGDLIATYSWQFSLFKNNTIVISGFVNPLNSSPLTLFPVNNY